MDAETGKPLVDVILDQAGAKGTGAWTVQTALEPRRPRLGHRRGRLRPLAVVATPSSARCRGDLPGPAEALDGRRRRRVHRGRAPRAVRVEDRRVLAGLRRDPRRRRASTTGRSTSARSSKIWRGGCIIRAQFLNRIADAYAETPDLPVLLTAPYFVEALGRAQDAWRRIVVDGRGRRHPRPRVLVVAGVLRRPARRPPARRPRAGPARLLRRAHLQAHRQGGHLPHPVVGRPHRDRGRRHALSASRKTEEREDEREEERRKGPPSSDRRGPRSEFDRRRDREAGREERERREGGGREEREEEGGGKRKREERKGRKKKREREERRRERKRGERERQRETYRNRGHRESKAGRGDRRGAAGTAPEAQGREKEEEKRRGEKGRGEKGKGEREKEEGEKGERKERGRTGAS